MSFHCQQWPVAILLSCQWEALCLVLRGKEPILVCWEMLCAGCQHDSHLLCHRMRDPATVPRTWAQILSLGLFVVVLVLLLTSYKAWQHSVWKMMGLESGSPGLECWLCHSLFLWPGAHPCPLHLKYPHLWNGCKNASLVGQQGNTCQTFYKM